MRGSHREINKIARPNRQSPLSLYSKLMLTREISSNQRATFNSVELK